MQTSMDAMDGGDAYRWFFVAMAHWHLDRKQEARRWYDKAVAWMDEKNPENPYLQRFRKEAAKTLGLPDEGS